MPQWFKFPTFEDPEKNSSARTLLYITLLVMALALFFDVLLLLFFGNSRSISLVAGVAVVSLGVHLAARRGYVSGSAFVLCLFIWLILTLVAQDGDERGVHNVAFNTYIIPVLLAGFLISGRAGFVFAVLGTLSGLWMLLRAPNGNAEFYDGILYWMAGSVSFGFAATLLWLSKRRIRRIHKKQLEERRRELQHETIERARAEDAYRTVVENSLQGLVIFQNDRIVFANSALSDMLGYSTDELLALESSMLIAIPEDRERIAQYRQDRMQGNSAPARYEFRALHRSGETRWIEVFPARITYQGQPAIQSAFVDITERKKAEAALREREESASQFQEKLKLLHEVSIELSITESFDELCKRAIELGRVKLGFDRLGLLLFDEQAQEMIGTFGTDAKGELRDERGTRGKLLPDSWIIDALRDRETVYFRDDIELSDNWQPAGRGWNAMSVLWTGEKSIGWLAADNLVEQKPLLSYQLELLKLYGLTLGHLVTRKRTEEALKRSEEWFAKVFQSAPISISISTIPEGHYVDVNPSWCALFGFKREEVLGRTGNELGLWADGLQREKLGQIVREEGRFHQVEVNLGHRDGKIYTAMMSSERVELNGKPHYLSMVSDITEQKRTLAALREREENTRLLQEKLKLLHEISIKLTRAESFAELCRKAVELGRSDLGFDRLGLLLFDEATKTMVGTFGTDQNGNLRDERMMSFDLQEEPLITDLLLNRESIYYREDGELSDFGKPIGRGWNLTVAMWDGSTSIGWLSADNLIHKQPLAAYQLELFKLYGLTLGHLVTRKRTEEALKRSEEWFANVFRMAPFAIAIRKVGALHYVDVNESWSALYGYSHEEAVGHTAADLNLWGDPEQRAHMLKKLADQGYLKEEEILVRRRDGAKRLVRLSTQTVDFHGSPHLLSTIADITERRQVEHQQLELALANERLELFREFMTNISHDLKTPLSVINTSVELMERVKDPERQKEKIAAIKEQTGRLDKYIQDMLTISRLDHAPDLMLRPVDLNRAATDVQERLSLTAEKKEIKALLELDTNTPYVLADEGELDRMLVNLVENALNYTPAGGCIWVRTHVDSENVTLEIADTGIGIGEQDLVRIFDRFYRADTARSTKISGTGLGLAIVKRIVEMHSGSIDVTSTPGVGTTFRLQFPLVSANEEWNFT